MEPEECESIGLKSSGISELGISYIINFEGRLGAHIYLPETNDKAGIYYPPFLDKPNLFIHGNKVNISSLAYSKFNSIVFALSGQYLPEKFVERLEIAAVDYANSIGETHIITKTIFTPFTPFILSHDTQSSTVSKDTDNQKQSYKSTALKYPTNSPVLLATTSHTNALITQRQFIEIVDDNDVVLPPSVSPSSTKASQKPTDDVSANLTSPIPNNENNSDTPTTKNDVEAKKDRIRSTLRSNFTLVTHKDVGSHLKPLYTYDFSQNDNPYQTISTSKSNSYLFFLPQGSLSKPQQIVVNTAEEGDQPTYHELYIRFKSHGSSRFPVVFTFQHRQNDEFQDATLTKGGPLTPKVLASKLLKDSSEIIDNGYGNFGVYDEQGVVRTLFTLHSANTGLFFL